MAEIPIATVKRMMKHAGALRVSDDAVNELSDNLENIIEDVTRRAVKYAEHAGRKTVTTSDVQLAI